MRRAFWVVVSAAAVAWIAAPQLGAVAESAENTAVSAIEIKEETDAYRIELSYPKFGIPTADAQVQSIVEKAIAEVKADPDRTPGLSKFDLTGSYSHVYVGADVISVRFDINTFLGGAHGSPAAYGLNFDPATGKAFTLDEALALIDKTLQQVSTESMTQLNAKLGSVMSPEGAEPIPENYSTFLIGPDTVTFIFQPYQVGSYADGMPEVEFPRLMGRHELSRNSEKSDGAVPNGSLVAGATGYFIYSDGQITNSARADQVIRVGERLAIADLSQRFGGYRVNATAYEDCLICATVEGPAGVFQINYDESGAEVMSIISNDNFSRDALGNKVGGLLMKAIGLSAKCEAGNFTVCYSPTLVKLRYIVAEDTNCSIKVIEDAETIVPPCAKIGGFMIEQSVARQKGEMVDW